MSAFDAVRDATAEAIRQAALEAFETIPKEALHGFGLCTHDDVDSVFHAYATRAWVSEREEDYPEIGLISVEWTQASGDAAFLAVSSALRQWKSSSEGAAQSDYDKDRKIRFSAMVEAMEACRAEGLFDAGTLLTVSSVDPDDDMVALACDAGRRLNTKEIAAAYCQMMGC